MIKPPVKDHNRKDPISWMARHAVTANLLMVVLLVGGFLWGSEIKQELFPEFDLDIVNVNVAYPGASPEEVERGIILAVEEAVEGLEGVKEITSTANEGSGNIRIEMIEGENINRFAQDIKNEIDRITSFPDETEEPTVAIVGRKRAVLSLALYGKQNDWVLRHTAENIRDTLLLDPEITQVELAGIRDFEISIEISQETLRTYNLTLDEIANRIATASVELPGGTIKTGAGDVLIRMKERRYHGKEFAKIPIITANDGTEVLLENIATIKDDFAETDSFGTFNGQSSIMIEVYRIGDQTPITVSDTVRDRMISIRQNLPPGLSIDIIRDRSDIYRQRLNLLTRNGLIGLSLVFILLAVFLEARLAFWVSLGIPISFLGSLFILSPLGVSINMITMFAFIIALGIVVDDAIVAGENIYHHRQQGLPWLDSAIRGAKEIAMPVTFSVMTNMVAFMPMFFVPGTMGKIFKYIPLVVISVFVVSLIESLFILPAHLGHQKVKKTNGPWLWIQRMQKNFSTHFTTFIKMQYGPFLRFVLSNRYITFFLGVSILILTIGFIQSGRMGFELFPKVESDFSQATIILPYGTAAQKTLDIQNKVVNAAREVSQKNGGDQLLKGIFANISESQSQIRVYLTDPDKRPISTAEFTNRWRKAAGTPIGIESMKFESDVGGPGRGAAITLELRHDNLEVLKNASQELANSLSYFPRVSDIDDGFSPGKQQIDFQVKPEARGLGLNSREIARQVRNAYYGSEALRQLRGKNEVKVMVRLPFDERLSEYHLEEMIIRTSSGKEIPLRQAVTFSRGRSYTSIERRNAQRVVTVSADVRPRSKAGEILSSLKTDILPQLQLDYPGLSYSFEGRQADMSESMESLMYGLLMALLVIYAMLAIPFNSYIQPIIVMACVPFGIVGAVIGHLLMGYSLSIMSMFGVVALSGVVINDSLVMIDFANRRRRAGIKSLEAIHSAGIQRFRPIMLTTLTTFGGLSPMIFETSRQARFLIPMAISLGFGIVFATVITLILVPSLYMIITDIRKLILGTEAASLPIKS
jgi:multidrug efflux pump subunit AcrB